VLGGAEGASGIGGSNEAELWTVQSIYGGPQREISVSPPPKPHERPEQEVLYCPVSAYTSSTDSTESAVWIVAPLADVASFPGGL
jgi:hypothetical protein